MADRKHKEAHKDDRGGPSAEPLRYRLATFKGPITHASFLALTPCSSVPVSYFLTSDFGSRVEGLGFRV
jgi:hypothetical protein